MVHCCCDEENVEFKSNSGTTVMKTEIVAIMALS